VVELFKAAGVPITLGSDAHVPDEAASGYADIAAEARRAGYTEYLRFDGRRRLLTPLPSVLR
jgi:histidinol phosphatase-like PHP family hydrolase